MKTSVVFTFVLALVCACDRNSDSEAKLSVRILAPVEGDIFHISNLIAVQLEAYDSAGALTQIDSQRWESDVDGEVFRYPGLIPSNVRQSMNITSLGLHRITAYAYRGSIVASDEIWMNVVDSFFVRLRFADEQWMVYDIPTSWVNALAVDMTGRLLVGTTHEGLIMGQGNDWEFVTAENSGLLSNEIQSIAVDGQNHVYVGDVAVNAINYYNGSSWSRLNIPDTLGDVHSIAFRGDTMWVADHGGRLVFRANNQWFAISQPQIFHKPDRIAFDSQGFLWGGSQSGGGFRYRNGEWTLFNPTTNGMPNCSHRMTITPEGHVWFGTCTEGLYRYDGVNWTKLDVSNSSLPSNQITDLYSDALGNVWIGTEEGLAKYNAGNWTVYNKYNSRIPENLITTLAIGDSNDVWIGTTHAVTRFRNP